jgi:hypothetical protein
MNPKLPRNNCKKCNKECLRHGQQYCSNLCQRLYASDQAIIKWLLGDNTIGETAIRTYLFKIQNSKCSLCGWCKVNPSHGKVPLELDHIDGNWKNNAHKNVRLICPNCHSLTPTFRALNKRTDPNRAKGQRKQLS